MILTHIRTITLFIITLLLTTGVWFFVRQRTEQSMQDATPHSTPQQEIAQHIPSKKTPPAQTTPQNDTTTPAQQAIGDTSQGASAGSEIDTSNWKIYRNSEIGVMFKYPPEWGEINLWKDEDCGDRNDDTAISNITTQTQSSCHQIALYAENAKPKEVGIFFVTETVMYAARTHQRAGYFGDLANLPQENLSLKEAICSSALFKNDSCIAFTTEKGIPVVHVLHEVFVPGLDKQQFLYFLKSGNPKYAGIVLSSGRLPYDMNQSKKIIETLLDTLQFI